FPPKRTPQSVGLSLFCCSSSHPLFFRAIVLMNATDSSTVPAGPGDSSSRPPATDPVGLLWLVTVRWTTLAAATGAVVAGRSGLDARVPVPEALAVLVAI